MELPRALIVAEFASTRQAGETRQAVRGFLQLLEEGVNVHLLVRPRSKPELNPSASRFASRVHYAPDVLLQKICWNSALQ